MKNNKQIRIKYNKKNYDYCEDNGWWSEELWLYDCQLDLFKCFYPVSSYEENFYTSHAENEVIGFLGESVRDFDNKYDKKTVTDIIVEEREISAGSLSIRELAIEKMKTMSDEEIKRRMFL